MDIDSPFCWERRKRKSSAESRADGLLSLSYAGIIRIRFKGFDAIRQSQPAKASTPVGRPTK